MKEGQKAIAESKKAGGMLTAQHLRKCFGIDHVSPALLDIVNHEACEVTRYAYITNLTTASNVYRDSAVSIEAFIFASNFATQILTGESPVDSFKRIFPDQYRGLVAAGKSPAEIAKTALLYRNTKLVIDLLEQSYVPAHLLYQDVFHKGIHRLVVLMNTAESEMVKFKAAESIVKNLKAPDKVKVELDIGIKKNGIIDELKATTLKLAQQQKRLLEQGASVNDLAEADIIEIS